MLSLAWVSIAHAWQSGIWPTTNHWTFGPTNDYVLVTNIACRSVQESWRQVSSTNYVPVLYTNMLGHSGPVPGYTNTPHVWTNTYYTDIGYDLDAATTGAWPDTNSYTNVTVSGVVTVTTTLVTVDAATVQDFKMDIMDLWSYDGYVALRERWYAIGATRSNATEDVDAIYKPRFYKSARANLEYQKAWIQANAQYFANKNVSSGGNLDAYFEGKGDVPIPTWAEDSYGWTGFCAAVNIPTNWAAYTPYRALNGYPAGAGHSATQTFTIVFPPGYTNATLTNTWINYCGDPVMFIGTNGQTFTTNCIHDVMDTFTDSDYTFKQLQDAYNQLVWTVGDAAPGPCTNCDVGDFDWLEFGWDRVSAIEGTPHTNSTSPQWPGGHLRYVQGNPLPALDADEIVFNPWAGGAPGQKVQIASTNATLALTGSTNVLACRSSWDFLVKIVSSSGEVEYDPSPAAALDIGCALYESHVNYTHLDGELYGTIGEYESIIGTDYSCIAQGASWPFWTTPQTNLYVFPLSTTIFSNGEVRIGMTLRYYDNLNTHQGGTVTVSSVTYEGARLENERQSGSILLTDAVQTNMASTRVLYAIGDPSIYVDCAVSVEDDLNGITGISTGEYVRVYQDVEAVTTNSLYSGGCKTNLFFEGLNFYDAGFKILDGQWLIKWDVNGGFENY